MPSAHTWRFFRAGGVDQVRLDRAEDILALEHLDQKLWVALNCPVDGLEFDARTLALLDSANDGQVRPSEILDAIAWLRSTLVSFEPLVAAKDGVALANLRQDTAEGRRVAAAARHVLAEVGSPDQREFTVADAERARDAFARARHNGDGVVPPATLADPELQKVAEAIVGCCGGVADRSGAPGYDRQRLDAFYAACAGHARWYDEAARAAADVLPLGDRTAAAAAALDAVAGKVEDYFGRCRLAAFDPRAVAALNREEAAYLAIAAKDLSVDAHEVAGFPLAQVAAGKPLPLAGAINPAWQAAMDAFRTACVAPLLGDEVAELTEQDWRRLQDRLCGYRDWQQRRAGAAVAPLGIDAVRAILAADQRAALQQAIDDDLAVAEQVASVTEVEKVARLQRDLRALLENYVNFRSFYAREKAVFQAGRLHIDGRVCELTLQVRDAGKHAALAAMAKSYLVYADCFRRDGEKTTIVSAVTAGDADNLFVGRNGIFYDRKGRDWIATITKVIDNPISIGQAFWSPYKKLVRWIEEQVAKRAAAADADAGARLQAAAATAGEAVQTGKAQPPKKLDIGVLAAISVAISGITAIVGTVLTAFFGLGWLMPVGFAGLLVLISGPSMLIAWFKLRQRNLGPLLDASGWAVNTLTRVNLPLGRSLTQIAALPPGAVRSTRDPFAQRLPRWFWVLGVLVLLLVAAAAFGLYWFGYLHRWLPGVGWLAPPVPEAGAAPAGSK